MPHTESTECSLISPIEQRPYRWRNPPATGEPKRLVFEGRWRNRGDRLTHFSKERQTSFAAIYIPALKDGVFRAKYG